MTLIVGGLTLYLALIVFEAVGVTQSYLYIPISLFVAFLAIWPTVKPTMPRETFRDWVAWELAAMVVLAVLMAAWNFYQEASSKLG